MKTLIEKWNPVMKYKFKDGTFVSEEKYQELAEMLETLETKYKNTDIWKDIMPLCIKLWAEGKILGGGLAE